MTIIEKIQKSIHDALDGRWSRFGFYYDTPETVSVRLDNAEFPCAFMHVIESGAVRNDTGVLREQLLVQMVFADTTELDFDGIENERIIDELKRMAFTWVQFLYRSSELQLDEIVGTTRLYATEDAILTGFAITVRLTELDGVSWCNRVGEY